MFFTFHLTHPGKIEIQLKDYLLIVSAIIKKIKNEFSYSEMQPT